MIHSKPVLPSYPGESCLTTKAADQRVPVELHNLLCWLVEGSEVQSYYSSASTRMHVPDHMRAKVSAIGQDIVYAATSGQILTPKHVALPSGCTPLS